jgi:hypothetical protein
VTPGVNPLPRTEGHGRITTQRVLVLHGFMNYSGGKAPRPPGPDAGQGEGQGWRVLGCILLGISLATPCSGHSTHPSRWAVSPRLRPLGAPALGSATIPFALASKLLWHVP